MRITVNGDILCIGDVKIKADKWVHISAIMNSDGDVEKVFVDSVLSSVE